MRESGYITPKIVLKKAVGKRSQSATKVARRLSRKGYPVSDRTARRYWQKTLGLKAYKIRVRPKLTEKQRDHRVKFCEERKHWTADDWKRVLFSDESTFELFHPPNSQNDTCVKIATYSATDSASDSEFAKNTI